MRVYVSDEAQESWFVNVCSVFGAYHGVHLYRRSIRYNPTDQFRTSLKAFVAFDDTHFAQLGSLPTPIRGVALFPVFSRASLPPTAMTTKKAARHSRRCPAWLLAAIVGLCAVPSLLVGQELQMPESDTGSFVAKESLLPGRLFEVVQQSICGPATDPVWTPLTIDTLFSEGWDEAWISPPSGSGGAPRMGWVNAADGHFNRNFIMDYLYTDRVPGTTSASPHSNLNLGVFQFQSPLSRRLWISLDVPFPATSQSVNGVPGKSSFGDFNVSTRVMLHETQDLSVNAGLGVRTDVGDPSTGTGQTRLYPQGQFWRDIGSGFVLRGGFGVDIATNPSLSPSATVSQLALGRFLTPHDAAPFGDLCLSLALVVRNNLGGNDPTSFVSLTPAIRTHLGRNYFLLAGWEVPVAGPVPFQERLTFQFIKVF